MRYERLQDPVAGIQCFREMSRFVERFSELTKNHVATRPDLFYNLGEMMAYMLYVRGAESLTWVEPFIDGVNSFMCQMSKHHVEKDPILIAFQHPNVPQA